MTQPNPHSAPPGSTSRRLIILGSTGSIGTNTLAVIEHLHARSPFRFDIVGLATGRSADDVGAQARRFNVDHVAIADGTDAVSLEGVGHIYRGPEAAVELIDRVARPGDLVVAAMVGSAGIPAVIRAIEAGCHIALANKETLVAAGAIVMPLVAEKDVHLLPVDSEHSAIFQCLRSGRSLDEVRRVILTASGGPFRDAGAREIASATVEDALNHPTWNMGAKVTIDSATLMNKALEVIEAHWLFGLEAERIDAIIHPQSIVHSFVEFIDGSVIAQLSPPDMKLPIQYALTWPHRAEGCAERVDWMSLADLAFQPIDPHRFPAIQMAHDVVRTGGTAGAIFNAANEVAVQAFLDREIPFGRIWEIVSETMGRLNVEPVTALDDVFEADRAAREIADELASQSATSVEAASR